MQCLINSKAYPSDKVKVNILSEASNFKKKKKKRPQSLCKDDLGNPREETEHNSTFDPPDK